MASLADVDGPETFEFDQALLLGGAILLVLVSTLPKATCAPLLLRLPIDEFLPCCCKGISAVQNTWIFIGYKFLSRADFGSISVHFL